MKKDKLIYILPKYDKNLDGHIYYLVNFIKDIGKEIDIFVLIEKSNTDNIKIDNIKGFYIQSQSNIILRSLELFYIIIRQRLKGYKKVYIHYSYIGAIFSSLVMRLSGGKTWYWNCGMMWLFKDDSKLLLKLSLKLVNYLVTGVSILQEGYSKHYNIKKSKIKIMPNRIELDRVALMKKQINIEKERKSLGYNTEDKIVLFVHRLAKRKGAHYILPTASLLLKNNKNIKLLVIGDGPYKEQLVVETKDLDNIKIIGKVANKDIYKYFLLADLFFMPSEEEGFPRVILETMACGTPYVASDIGGTKEISPECQKGYIYNVGDIKGYTEGIETIINKKFDFSKYINRFDKSEVKKIFISIISG